MGGLGTYHYLAITWRLRGVFKRAQLAILAIGARYAVRVYRAAIKRATRSARRALFYGPAACQKQCGCTGQRNALAPFACISYIFYCWHNVNPLKRAGPGWPRLHL